MKYSIDIKERLYSYNYKVDDDLLKRYLKLLSKCDNKSKSIILDYLKPIRFYFNSREYNNFINMFEDAFVSKIDLLEYLVNSNKFDNINKLYFVKKVIIDSPLENKENIHKVYEYFEKFCKTFKSDLKEINNDSVRDYIIELINSCSLSENIIFNIVHNI